MTPYKFPQATITAAKDQPEYQPLPMCLSGHDDGCMATCWKLTWWERIKLLWRGVIWIEVLTFHRGIPPQRPSVDPPDFSTYGYDE